MTMKKKERVTVGKKEHRYLNIIRRYVPHRVPRERATLNTSDMMWFLRNCSVLAHNDQSVYDAVNLAKNILKEREGRR